MQINNVLPPRNLQTQTAPLPLKSKPNAPRCSNCDDKRYYRYDVEPGHVFFGKLFPCPECNKQEVDYNSGLRERERNITLDMVKTANRTGTQNMVAAARKFIAKPSGFLSLHGANGTGKTMITQAIVNAATSKGIEARYLTASELSAALRETFKDGAKDTDYSLLHKFAKIPVLIIDELDKLRDTPYSREIQQELINLRYRDADILGTVLAWNGELEDLPWQAVISRASEFVVVRNVDVDMRKLLGDVK